MAIDWSSINYDDPCVTLAALRPLYYKWAAGERAVEIRFEGQSSRFTETGFKELGKLIATLEVECAAKQGKRKRFAISAGYRRRSY